MSKQVDPDLTTLMEMLEQHKFEQNYLSWFSLPWRDGWCAAKLAFACHEQYAFSERRENEIRRNRAWCDDKQVSPRLYEEASAMIAVVAQRVMVVGTNYERFHMAGLRCVQLLISNSHGGGNVYNDVLSHAFGNVPNWWPNELRRQVRDARCEDAIGVPAGFDGTSDDKLREAFKIAWDRGLFQAAYALPRAKGAL